jgi:hypothetical protein
MPHLLPTRVGGVAAAEKPSFAVVAAATRNVKAHHHPITLRRLALEREFVTGNDLPRIVAYTWRTATAAKPFV